MNPGTLRRRSLAAALTVCLAGGLLAASPAPVGAATTSAVAFGDADGITVTQAVADGPRLWRLTLATAALARPVHVNVLLPDGYASTTRRYPTLYLFHGTSGGADDWLKFGNVTAATAGLPMIVVMPDAGYDGDGGSWFTNWVDQHTTLGTANWETFHVDQLVPFIDGSLRTIASRDGRAIAGLSQGGFGSFTYAARHPDVFGSAASFSGAPDIASNPVVLAGATAIISGTASGLDQVQPFAMFGDPVTNNINWQGHNPASLVTNLDHTQLRLWVGNGIPGPLDTNPVTALGGTPIEAAVHISTLSFAQVATAAHVPYQLDDYGPGTHTYPYWSRDLVAYLADLQPFFAQPQDAPATVDYRSVDRTWTQWGWTVANHRAAAQAFSALSDASPRGFTFTGTSATVTTPPAYRPGATYGITVNGGTAPTSAVADSSGRLALAVTAGLGSAVVTVTAPATARG